jgi:hypothetical protein
MAVLLGKLSIVNNSIPSIKVDGLWAMSEDAFSREIVGEKSKFEMILSNEEYLNNSKNLDPITYLAKKGGKYNATGYFNLFQTNGDNLKVDERDIVLTFTKNKSPISSKSPSRSTSPTPPRSISPLPDNVGIMFNILGNGINDFGKFQVTGILDNNGVMKLFKSYPIDTTITKSEKPVRKRVEKVPIEETTKEILKRSRRPSTSLLESLEEPVVNSFNSTSSSNTSPRNGISTTTPKSSSSPRSNPSSSNLSVKTPSRSASNSNLASRVNFNDTPNKTRIETKFMSLCSNLLTELKRLPQSLWFHEPVNHISLGLTDYLEVVKQPMDFQTIDINLKQGKYLHPEEYGKHMKLVFNNAIIYNKDSNNPCSIAAKELLEYFDENFRKLCSEYSTSLSEAGYAWKSKKNREEINKNNNNSNVIVNKKVENITGPRVDNAVELSDKVGNMEHLVVIQDVFTTMKLEMKNLGLDKNNINSSTSNEINIIINNNNCSSSSSSSNDTNSSNSNRNSSSMDIDLNDNNLLNERKNLLINKIMNLDEIERENFINILKVIDSTVIRDTSIDKKNCASINDKIIELNRFVRNLNIYTFEMIESSIP